MDKKTIMIFGLGILQRSLIEHCKMMNLITLGIDPDENAVCKDLVDYFEVVDGQDYALTIEKALKYKISGIITTATDKPLVIMAKVAEKLHLPFYSPETAEFSTDKLRMKEVLQAFEIPCAKGILIKTIEDVVGLNFTFPVIVKPRDNSGSRGVLFCKSKEEIKAAIKEALQYTHKSNVLVEEFIEGDEFSVESIHLNGKTYVLQITEKITTDFPYNVELGHIQPANLPKKNWTKIIWLINQVAKALHFDNCGSHTELKINSRGIFIIETSPRLGGDFITSTLVPLSTGIDMETLLIKISIGEKVDKNEFSPNMEMSSGVIFFELPEGFVTRIESLESLETIIGLQTYKLDLHIGDRINKITNSLNRYGEAIFQCPNRDSLLLDFERSKKIISEQIFIDLKK